MKDPGVVFFFTQGGPIWVTQLKYYDQGYRGRVINGAWWVDYNACTKQLKACRATQTMVDDPTQWGGWNWKHTIHWDDPVTVVENSEILHHIDVDPSLVDEYPEYYYNCYDDIIHWARELIATKS